MRLDLQTLASLDGHQFEDVIEHLLTKMGFQVQGRSRSADGGIDMIAVNTSPLLRGTYVIQCKRYTNPISASVVRDLYGVVTAEAANKGILITTSRFTADARRFADSKPLELLDGEELQQLLMQHGILAPSSDSTLSFITPGTQVLYNALYKPLARTMDSIKRITDGRTYLPKNEVNIQQYAAVGDRLMLGISAAFEALQPLLPEIMQTVNDAAPSRDALSELRTNCNEVARICTQMISVHKELCSVVPPQHLQNAHLHAKRIVPELVERLWDIAAWAKIAVEERRSAQDKPFKPLENEALEAFHIELGHNVNALNRKGPDIKRSTCFVATAAYDCDAVELSQLRLFRDAFLSQFLFGRAFVAAYEYISPPLARWISRKNRRREMARMILSPAVRAIKKLNAKLSADQTDAA